MQLTVEQLVQTLSGLRSDAATPVRGQRRVRPRVGVRLRMTILPCDTHYAPGTTPPTGTRARPVHVKLRDLSSGGFGFLHDRPLVAKQMFVITLPREVGGMTSLLGEVQRCERLDEGVFQIGSQIRLDMPEDEMRYYLAASGLKRSA